MQWARCRTPKEQISKTHHFDSVWLGHWKYWNQDKSLLCIFSWYVFEMFKLQYIHQITSKLKPMPIRPKGVPSSVRDAHSWGSSSSGRASVMPRPTWSCKALDPEDACPTALTQVRPVVQPCEVNIYKDIYKNPLWENLVIHATLIAFIDAFGDPLVQASSLCFAPLVKALASTVPFCYETAVWDPSPWLVTKIDGHW